MILIYDVFGNVHEFKGSLSVELFDADNLVYEFVMREVFPSGKPKRPFVTHRTVLAVGSEDDMKAAMISAKGDIERIVQDRLPIGIVRLPMPVFAQKDGE